MPSDSGSKGVFPGLFSGTGSIPFLALLAMIGLIFPHSAGPVSKAEQETRANANAERKAQSTAPRQVAPPGTAPCPISPAATVASFFGDCHAAKRPAGTRVPRFLLATIPNPEFGSLGYVTDSVLDSLRLSMQAVGYLPFTLGPAGWPKPRSKADSSVSPGTEAPSSEPGWWLYSRGDQLIVAFLIGEDPVAGIDRRQFAKAMEWAKVLGADGKRTVLLAGPVFSGGAQSLADAVAAVTEEWTFQAASGTASHAELPEVMRISSKSVKLVWRQLAVVSPMEKAVGHICGNRPNASIMLLSEAHTRFGNFSFSPAAWSSKGCAQGAIAFLPRDLSLLRGEYQKNPRLFQRMFPSGSLPSGLLPAPLVSTATMSGVTVYMPETLAKSQEITLHTLARRLKSEHVQYLGVNVTDRLDALFLARFFGEESPNVRVFLIGSDALFNSGSARGSLTGTLTYSSYPIGIAGGDRLPYPNDVAAGFGYAVRSLLTADIEYALPLPYYVSVIGRGGEWPFGAALKSRAGMKPREGRKGPLLAFVVTLLALTGIPIARWRLSSRQQEPGSKTYLFAEFLRRVAPFAWRPYFSADVWRTLTCGSARRGFRDDGPQGREWKRFCWLLVLAILWLALVAESIHVFHHIWSGESDAVEAIRRVILTNGVNPMLPYTCFVLSIYSFFWMRVRGRFLDNYSFHVLPQGPAYSHAADEEENAPTLDNPSISACCQALKRTMQGGFSLKWLGIALLVVLGFLLAYDLSVESIEQPHFPGDLFWTALAMGTYTTTISALIYFLIVWIRLFRVLRSLEAHPIRNAFTRLPDRISWTSIWSIGGLRPTFVSLQLAADYLTVLQEKMRGQADEAMSGEIDAAERQAVRILALSYADRFPDGGEGHQPLCPSQMVMLQQACERVGQSIEQRLESTWRLSRLEGWRASSIDYASAEERNKHYFLGAIDRLRNPDVETMWTTLRKLQEEFLALMFSSYIRYVFMQLRNIAGSVALSVSLLFIAFHTYPFHPHQSLLNATTFLFLSVAAIFIAVFYQMDIDPLLSRLSDTQAGKLDAGFAKRLLQFGLLPTMTYLISQFPELGDVFLGISEIIPGLPK